MFSKKKTECRVCGYRFTPERENIYTAEIRFVRGRLRFTDDDGNAADPAPFPSMVVIYNGERVKNE